MKKITLSEAAKEKRREYARLWRKRNPGKVREANRRYWEKVAERDEEEREENGKTK